MSSRTSSAVDGYKVLIKPSAVKELEGVSSLKDRKRIAEKIGGLGVDPRPPGSVKLSGEEKYRLRHRHYRVVYAIDDQAREVRVVRIAQRKEIYR